MSGEQFSDYIVFVDESGDHGMETIDPDYPLFVLAFCVMSKTDYVRQLTPAMQSVKFKLFGHDNIVLHERDIRKDSGDFRCPSRWWFWIRKATHRACNLPILVARTVGIHEIRPDQANRAYDALFGKFYRNASGNTQGWGLNCFP